MKGQAFVGLPTEQSAEKALRETNGYVLYDKPLIVVSFSSSWYKGGTDGWVSWSGLYHD